MEHCVVLAREEGIFVRVDHVVEHRCCLAVLALEEVSLAQQSLCKLFGGTDTCLTIVGIILGRQCTTVDSLCEVFLYNSPEFFRSTVALLILIWSQEMVYHRRSTKEGYELEMSECTKHLCLVDGTLHDGTLTLSLVDEEVCLVNDAIKAFVEALDHPVVRVEAVLIEFLHLPIVTTLATTTPEIVGEKVLNEEPVVICGLHLQIERSCTRHDVVVCGVVCVHATHVAVLLDVELAVTADGHQRHHTQQCDI